MPSTRTQIPASPYPFPFDSSLSPHTTALVVIDMQQDFCSPGGYLEKQGYEISPVRAIIPQVQRLLAGFREVGFPVFHTREGHPPTLSTLSARELFRSRNNPSALGIGSPGPLGRLLIRGERGHDTIPELYPHAGEVVLDKPGKGAFAHTEFENLLREKGVRNLVFAGVTTDVCVSSTMREGSDRGFDCLLVRDCTEAAGPGMKEAAIESVMAEGGVFGTVAEVGDVLGVLEGWVGEV